MRSIVKRWSIALRRRQLSEHTLELVVEAPTVEAARKAALAAALKANAGDLEWELHDYDWVPGEPPTVASYAEAGEDAVPDLVADGDGNVIGGGNPAMPAFRASPPPGIRIVTGDD
jgi:hypothetical protein